MIQKLALAAILALFAAAQAGSVGPAREAANELIGRAGANLEWPLPPRSARYRVADLLLTMRNDVDRRDPGILRRSLVIEMPGYPPFTIDPGENDAYEPAVMVVENPPGAPMILFQTFSGGAHCCTSITAIVPREGRLEAVDVYRGDGAPMERAPRDVDGDGAIDIVRHDNAFLYAFASYAESYAPPRIVNIVDGEAVDVSERPGFSSLFEEAMAEARQACPDPDGYGANGACAAYVAAAARLGRFDEAWAQMLEGYDRTSAWGLDQGCRVAEIDGECPAGEAIRFDNYPDALRNFLAEHGYIPH